MALAALPDEIRAALPAMLGVAEASIAPASEEMLAAPLSQTMALLGAGMSDDARDEWMLAASIELRKLPAHWAIDGLSEARSSCKWLREVIPFVIDYAEDYPNRERKRVAQLRVLVAALASPKRLARVG